MPVDFGLDVLEFQLFQVESHFLSILCETPSALLSPKQLFRGNVEHTEFKSQCGGDIDLCPPAHLDVDGHPGARIGRQQGEEVAGSLPRSRIERREGRRDGGDVFGQHDGGWRRASFQSASG